MAGCFSGESLEAWFKAILSERRTGSGAVAEGGWHFVRWALAVALTGMFSSGSDGPMAANGAAEREHVSLVN